jgi:hypothetical protein
VPPLRSERLFPAEGWDKDKPDEDTWPKDKLGPARKETAKSGSLPLKSNFEA